VAAEDTEAEAEVLEGETRTEIHTVIEDMTGVVTEAAEGLIIMTPEQ